MLSEQIELIKLTHRMVCSQVRMKIIKKKHGNFFFNRTQNLFYLITKKHLILNPDPYFETNYQSFVIVMHGDSESIESQSKEYFRIESK